MTDEAREQILANIRRSLKRGPLEAPIREALDQRLAAPRRGIELKRTRIDHTDLIELFATMAEKAAATVVRLANDDEIGPAISSVLKQHNLPASLVVSPELKGLDWASQKMLEVRFDRATIDDLVSVTPAHAGIAETGTLMLMSAKDRPTTLNFLPDTHIVVLKASDVVATYEDGWDRWRKDHKDGPPRTANFVTGPSRTGDIEQQLLLGAHGPRRLVILLVGGDG
jgi:L-lactate dehydrogenase complex protein LldG